jgi:hypothetical protein
MMAPVPPATAPSHGNTLSPEQRRKMLLAQGWSVGQDGSMVSPEGQTVAAFDTPADVATFTSYDTSAGGFGAARGPSVPATAPPAGQPLAGAALDTPQRDKPFRDPLFDQNMAVREATPPDANPMKDALPTPFDAPEVTPPLRAQPAPDLKAAAGAAMSRAGDGSSYQGRVGRRMPTRSSSSRRRR